MTRYHILGREPRYDIVLGWDKPLHTYFAQVWDKTPEPDSPVLVLFAGANYGEVPTCEHLELLLKPYVNLPEALCIQLTVEKEEPLLDLIPKIWAAVQAELSDDSSPFEPEE